MTALNVILFHFTFTLIIWGITTKCCFVCVCVCACVCPCECLCVCVLEYVVSKTVLDDHGLDKLKLK